MSSRILFLIFKLLMDNDSIFWFLRKGKVIFVKLEKFRLDWSMSSTISSAVFSGLTLWNSCLQLEKEMNRQFSVTRLSDRS